MIENVKEIEPWGIYEQTAWDYVRAMVEEDEKYKLLQKMPLLHDRLRNIYFEYNNRSVKMVMLPVVIAQNNNLHEFFTIFISGVTGHSLRNVHPQNARLFECSLLSHRWVSSSLSFARTSSSCPCYSSATRNSLMA